VSSPDQPIVAPPAEDDDEEEDDEEEEEDESSSEEEDEDEEEDDEEEEEDDEEEDEGAAAPVASTPSEWLPNWAPYAVLAVLVSVSFLVGLGLVGGPPAPAEPEAAPEPATVVKKAVKPSGHP
jgi:hypothetical protein